MVDEADAPILIGGDNTIGGGMQHRAKLVLFLDAGLVQVGIIEGDADGIGNSTQHFDNAFIEAVWLIAHDAEDANDFAACVHRSHDNRAELLVVEARYGKWFGFVQVVVDDNVIGGDDATRQAFAERNAHRVLFDEIAHPTLLRSQDNFACLFVNQADSACLSARDIQDSLQGGFECHIQVERLADAGGDGIDGGKLVNAAFDFLTEMAVLNNELL